MNTSIYLLYRIFERIWDDEDKQEEWKDRIILDTTTVDTKPWKHEAGFRQENNAVTRQRPCTYTNGVVHRMKSSPAYINSSGCTKAFDCVDRQPCGI